MSHADAVSAYDAMTRWLREHYPSAMDSYRFQDMLACFEAGYSFARSTRPANKAWSEMSTAERAAYNAGVEAALSETQRGDTAKAWRCYWCDALFTDRAKAETHFGAPHSGRPAPECYRLLQREVADLRSHGGSTKVPEGWKLSGLWQIANTDFPERSYFGHSWVRHSPTGDMALDAIEWCQWCGKHKAEVQDWMDNPICDALQAARAMLAAAPSNGKGEKDDG